MSLEVGMLQQYFILPFFIGLALGCDCIYIPTCERLNSTQVIFLGHVAEGGATDTGMLRFVVEESFKGMKPNTREVEVSPDLCGSTYAPGKRYLVLARRSNNGSLFTGGCMGTRTADGADEDIEFVRQWARGESKMYLLGRTAENVEDSMVRFDLEYDHKPPLTGVEIIATKDGKTFGGLSDANGSFRIEVPEPGNYRVVARYPDHASTLDEYRFRVEQGSCKEQDIGMWTDSKISGRILSPSGQPLPRVPVQMEPVSKHLVHPDTVLTNGEGRFEFTKIPRGEYVLGVNINGLASRFPYEPHFFPGVSKREDASLVRVRGASVLKGLDFQVGTRRPTRNILVKVTWPDGRPVTNASVDCKSLRSDDRRFTHDWISRWTDPHGEAVCEVLADRDFEIEAGHLAWSASGMPVQPVDNRPKVFVGAGTEPFHVQIVVDSINDISEKEAPTNMSWFNDHEDVRD
jgi:hypothetical protein